MALYPTVPICIQLTDYELETPHLGVAPVFTVVPRPPPPYNPSLYPPLYDVGPPPYNTSLYPPLYDVEPPHNLPQYFALVGVNPAQQRTTNVPEAQPRQTPEDKEAKVITKEVILNKKDGKFGIKTAVIHKNIFIYKVTKGSAAAAAGLKMGDQILKVNCTCVTGMSNELVHDVIRRCPSYGIKFTIRSRKDYSIFKALESVKKTFSDM